MLSTIYCGVKTPFSRAAAISSSTTSSPQMADPGTQPLVPIVLPAVLPVVCAAWRYSKRCSCGCDNALSMKGTSWVCEASHVRGSSTVRRHCACVLGKTATASWRVESASNTCFGMLRTVPHRSNRILALSTLRKGRYEEVMTVHFRCVSRTLPFLAVALCWLNVDFKVVQ